MSSNGTVKFLKVEAKAATEKALCVVIDGGWYWIPQSVITGDSEVWRKGDVGALVIKKWFADKSGLSEVLKRITTRGKK